MGTTDVTEEDKPASKQETGKTAEVTKENKPARKHETAKTASVHEDKSAVSPPETNKKVHPVRFAIHSHDLTFAASKNGAVWRGKLGGGTTPLLEWVADDGANMSLSAEPFRRKDIHEGWVERIILARNQARTLSVMTSKRQQKRFMIGDFHADWLTIVAGGLKMIVYSS